MAVVTVVKNSYTVDSLYQWDLNRVLEIRGLSLASTPEIHFTNSGMDRAIVRQATMNNAGVITVDVPNSLLQKPNKITAYVCIYEGVTFKSLYKIEIPVKARTQPSDYTFEDDHEIYSFNALENAVANLLDKYDEVDKKHTTAINAMNEAKSAYKNAKDEVEKAVAEAAKTAVKSLKPEDIGVSVPEIIVTAVAGSVVTCKKGNTVLSVEEVNATWTFKLPDYGMWVITVDDIAVEVVKVDTVKIYEVDALTQLVNYTMLYDHGDQCTVLTGGFTSATASANSSTRTVNEDNLQLITNANATTGYPNPRFYTVNKLDRTGYAGHAAVADVTVNLEGSGGHIAFAADPAESYNSQFDTAWVNETATKAIPYEDFESTEYSRFGYPLMAARNGKINIKYYAMWFYKADNWKALVELAGVEVPETIDTLLLDSSTLGIILANKDCVTIMIKTCTGEFMTKAIRSDTFLTALESSPYKEQVYANEHWAKFLAMVT